MQVALRHGLRGIGDAASDFDFDYDWIMSDPDAGYAITRDPGIPFGPQPADPLSSIIPYGQAGGQMTGAVSPLNPNSLVAAIQAGTVVLSKTLAGGGKVCPSGYATPQGGCVPVQGAGAGAGQILPGVSNQTLAVGAGILLFLMVMMKGKR